MKSKNNHPNKPMSTLTLITLLIGAAGSLCFMFIAGHNNKSVILMGLFTTLGLSPYPALFGANRTSFISTKQLNYLVPVISFGSVLCYTFGYFSPGKTPAFIFLLVPFISWMAISIVALLAKKRES